MGFLAYKYAICVYQNKLRPRSKGGDFLSPKNTPIWVLYILKQHSIFALGFS